MAPCAFCRCSTGSLRPILDAENVVAGGQLAIGGKSEETVSYDITRRTALIGGLPAGLAATTGTAKAAASASCCGHGTGLPHLARTDVTAPNPGSVA